MFFDPENNVNKLCANGVLLEGMGKPAAALALFMEAWNVASDNMEKFTAAHFVARHQNSVADKLKWDETALSLALAIDNASAKASYPSLYLNIAKCHEDLNDFVKARETYLLALDATAALPDDGYSNMIRAEINRGLDRVK
jgi:rifampin ADP-ribosylating transferase